MRNIFAYVLGVIVFCLSSLIMGFFAYLYYAYAILTQTVLSPFEIYCMLVYGYIVIEASLVVSTSIENKIKGELND